jgi:hypothetical protein
MRRAATLEWPVPRTDFDRRFRDAVSQAPVTVGFSRLKTTASFTSSLSR